MPTLNVEVPPGTQPGQTVQIQTPDGQMIQFPVPDTWTPGEPVTVNYEPRAQPESEVPMGIPVGEPTPQPAVVGMPQVAPPPGQQVMAQAVPLVPMQAILQSLQKHSALEIIEKADMKEMAVNAVMGFIGTRWSVDLPNKYNIRGQNGEELFYAVETTSVLDSTLGWDHGLDVVYTEGGSVAPMWKMRGDFIETTVANASTDEVEGTIWEKTEEWCCPFKSLSTFGCHANQYNCFPGVCCLCEACFQCCCCCWNAHTYLIDTNITPGTVQHNNSVDQMGMERQNSKEMANVNSNKTTASIAIVDRRPITLPWICTGCFGEGSDWAILKNPKMDESQKPLEVWNGEQIGKLRRRGRGLIATWIIPDHDSDHWKLDLSGTSNSKDKLAALATVLFMDHANQDQANDA